MAKEKEIVRGALASLLSDDDYMDSPNNVKGALAMFFWCIEPKELEFSRLAKYLHL